MKKIEIVFRAIIRSGLNPTEFLVHPSPFGEPVVIEKYQRFNSGETNLISDNPDSSSKLILHPDDGIKRLTEQIKGRYLH